ncbi:hypothetical protein MY11210_007971 [Beauveria gryllotalpidicola]
MKAVIFGATGLVGNEVLNACIATDKITKVYVVTRRALVDDREKNPKVDVILHSDFAQYPPELLDRLKGIELCLWAIGGVLSKFNNDKKLAYAANVAYPCAAATAFVQHLVNDSPSGRIRFVFCSGKFAEPNPAKSLWFLGESRRWKGETETFLQTLAKQHPGRFEAFAVRPGLVIPNNPPPAIRLATVVSPGITAQQTGTVMNSQSDIEDVDKLGIQRMTDYITAGEDTSILFFDAISHLIASMSAEDCAAKITLLVLLSIALLCLIGAALFFLASFLWRKWQIYWHGHRAHVSGLQKFRDLWPRQSAADINLSSINHHSSAADTNLPSTNEEHSSAADTNLPANNEHSSVEQSRKMYWRAKVWEKLSGRKAGASGQGDSVIEPPMPTATTDGRQYIGYMV